MKIIVTSILMALVLASSAHAVRIKDLASFEGARENQLVGYGLVVGLNGTGDSDQARIQLQSISAMLERMGVSINPNLIKVKNVAAVMVTATLPLLQNRVIGWMYWFPLWETPRASPVAH